MDTRLDKDGGLLWVYPRSHKQARHLAHILAQLLGILGHGEGVEINHAEETIVVMLNSNEVFDGPQVVAQGQHPRGLNAGKYTFHQYHSQIYIKKTHPGRDGVIRGTTRICLSTLVFR